MNKIGFVGTDARTLMAALVVEMTTSETCRDKFHGIVFRGMPAMPPFAKIMGWTVEFIPTDDNSPRAYAKAIIEALREGKLDCVMIMPEDLLYQGVVDEIVEAGFGDCVIGLTSAGSFIEGDKAEAKKFFRQAGVPVADEWTVADARNYKSVLSTCLKYIGKYGGAVLKYPYSAGGKGARVILDTWQIRSVYNGLMKDYKKDYRGICGKGEWPLLIESRMSGVEISFTALVDKNGNFQILPTAMDYSERFPGPAGPNNPITGGMGSISPHPAETPRLLEMAGEKIFRPLVSAMKNKGILKPCVLYPGCFVSLDETGQPADVRVCEVNIRPGEPEFQPIVRRIRNLGALIKAMLDGNLDEVQPEVRADQISIAVALVTGPGGPKGQKGYPWSCTKGEIVDMDIEYLRKKKITLIPSAMTYTGHESNFLSDGSRVAFISANATVKSGQKREEAAEALRQKLLTVFNGEKVRVVPRENKEGNRLAVRPDIGEHYKLFGDIFSHESESG